MEESTPKYRTRVNVSTSVKGIKTWDCTVEEVSDNIPSTQREIVLAASDALAAELDKRYPPQVV
uniref:Uncharacterized protein n=1 Tax=viral metagenome TaxID=1070528 RepID=A0A6M3JHZ0_9ZZZZ